MDDVSLARGQLWRADPAKNARTPWGQAMIDFAKKLRMYFTGRSPEAPATISEAKNVLGGTPTVIIVVGWRR
jgi:hypothetical protein